MIMTALAVSALSIGTRSWRERGFLDERLEKRHKRQVARVKNKVRLSEPDVRTQEQTEAVRKGSRAVVSSPGQPLPPLLSEILLRPLRAVRRRPIVRVGARCRAELLRMTNELCEHERRTQIKDYVTSAEMFE